MRGKIVETPGYKGPERRRHARRRRGERRKTVRWEPWKEDRRQIKGRRRTDLFYFYGIH